MKVLDAVQYIKNNKFAENSQYEWINLVLRKVINNEFTEEDILNAYYDVFRNLGLKDDNIKFLTEEGLSDAEVIEYIEKITSKSLLELARETIKYRSNMSFY